MLSDSRYNYLSSLPHRSLSSADFSFSSFIEPSFLTRLWDSCVVFPKIPQKFSPMSLNVNLVKLFLAQKRGSYPDLRGYKKRS